MKFLTICQGGNVRSVGMGFMLKYSFGQDAIAASWDRNSEATLRMLGSWADRILLMENWLASPIPQLAWLDEPEFRGKVEVANVGPDRFGYAFHPELQNICGEWCQKNVMPEPAGAK
jgi:hypothetical protein